MVVFVDLHNLLEFMDLVDGEIDGLLHSLPSSLRHGSFHIVSPDGRVTSGEDALPIVMGLLPGGKVLSRLITRAPCGRWALAFVYRTFSRLHYKETCHYEGGRGPDTLAHAQSQSLQ